MSYVVSGNPYSGIQPNGDNGDGKQGDQINESFDFLGPNKERKHIV
jgi:hypothetical protein